MSVGQYGRRPPAVSREKLSLAVRALVQWMGDVTGRVTHISKYTRAVSAAVVTKLRLNCIDVNYITTV